MSHVLSQQSRYVVCLATVLVAQLVPVLNLSASEASGTQAQIEFFEKHVRPLFAEHCYSCHSVSAEKIQAGLLMDSRDSLLVGGDSGEAIIPGDADGSLLIEAVRYESYEMPPKGKLADADIETLERWVQMGAPWPQEDAPDAESQPAQFDLQKRKAEHWAWQPIQLPSLPKVVDTAWPQDDLDRFVLAKLEEANLSPARDIDRAALMRRLYFDLVGLPPTAEQAAAFINNSSSDATERLVDDLLDSPHFGERWGRHWLDLVRYAESRGHEYDNDAPNAFQYRDYVIRALNADIPYDQLVREHLAGDLLSSPRLNSKERFNESILGTGFWYLGEWTHSPVDIRKDESDRFDNMIDVMSKTFLGVTVSCARCHDHKFDAISTADYYSLSGFLQSSDYRQVRFESIEQNRQIAEQLVEVNSRYGKQLRGLLDAAGVPFPDPISRLDDEAIVFDFSNIEQQDYMQDGFVFGLEPLGAGEPYFDFSEPSKLRIATHGAAMSDRFWNGLKSITEGKTISKSAVAKLSKSGRTLRSPTFELKDGTVSCLVEGTGHVVACVDSHRLVFGPLHKKTVQKFDLKEEGWVTLDLQRYAGHRLHLEFVPAHDSLLSVRMAVQGTDSAGLPATKLQQIQRRLSAIDKPFREYAVAAEAILHPNAEAKQDEVAESRSATRNNGATQVVLVNRNGIARQSVTARRIMKDWQRERSRLGSQVVHTSRLALAMMDGTGEDDRVLIRGNSSKPGDVESRHFLTAVTGNQPMPIAHGSGRLELAEQVNDPANPLTSRVIANRIWHYLIGRGIVPTTDDFGVLGQRPTHPELLDHLASRFLNDGRSIKQMIRSIVLSRTYQMSSHVDPVAVAADPSNRLWHHRSPKRLEGEVIRDALLKISGRLDETRFGASVPVHLTSFMDGRGRPRKSGPLDGDGRRSIYISVRRNFLSPFMTTFDSPTPFSTMGRRNVSNVPAQALILMNDPLVVELANAWAERAIQLRPDADSRIEWMYQTAFSRSPTLNEKTIANAYLQSMTADTNAANDELELWAGFAHALVNTKEFIFLR